MLRHWGLSRRTTETKNARVSVPDKTSASKFIPGPKMHQSKTRIGNPGKTGQTERMRATYRLSIWHRLVGLHSGIGRQDIVHIRLSIGRLQCKSKNFVCRSVISAKWRASETCLRIRLTANDVLSYYCNQQHQMTPQTGRQTPIRKLRTSWFGESSME